MTRLVNSFTRLIQHSAKTLHRTGTPRHTLTRVRPIFCIAIYFRYIVLCPGKNKYIELNSILNCNIIVSFYRLCLIVNCHNYRERLIICGDLIDSVPCFMASEMVGCQERKLNMYNHITFRNYVA